MKKLILLLSASLLSINVHASDITLYNRDAVKLNDIQDNQLNVTVYYSGKKISGICSVVIKAHGGEDKLFKALANQFTYTDKYASPEKIEPNMSTARAVVIPLGEYRFVDTITISTKNGKSIAENISAAFPGPDNEIGLSAGVCS